MMTIALAELNYWAVVVGGIVYMMLGALYFSPLLFGSTWVKLNRVNLEGKADNPLKYVGSTIVAFASSFLVAVIVQASGASGVGSGLAIGLLLGVLLALAYLKNMLFGLTSKKVYAIAAGDHLIAFALLGMLHAVWK